MHVDRAADRRRRIERRLDGRGSRRPRPEQARRRVEPELRGRLRHLAGHGDDGGDRGHVRRQRVRVDLDAARGVFDGPRRGVRHRDHGSGANFSPRVDVLAFTPGWSAVESGDGGDDRGGSHRRIADSHRRVQRPSRGFGLVPFGRGPHANGSLDSRGCAKRVRGFRDGEYPNKVARDVRGEQARDGGGRRPDEQLDVHLAAVRARRDVPQRVPQGSAAPALGGDCERGVERVALGGRRGHDP
mmetsp:Transcript_5424/g.20373  ORF Transcript_5424/g.20373 Transcript_5424/m.20373 type:complete len:243 (+) Transcript_5424:1143-1871(+)